MSAGPVIFSCSPFPMTLTFTGILFSFIFLMNGSNIVSLQIAFGMQIHIDSYIP